MKKKFLLFVAAVAATLSVNAQIYTGSTNSTSSYGVNSSSTYVNGYTKSNGTYVNGNGKTIHTGSRGGQYYINSKGNKTYVPKRR